MSNSLKPSHWTNCKILMLRPVVSNRSTNVTLSIIINASSVHSEWLLLEFILKRRHWWSWYTTLGAFGSKVLLSLSSSALENFIISPTDKGGGLHLLLLKSHSLISSPPLRACEEWWTWNQRGGLELKLHKVHLVVKFSKARLRAWGELDYQVQRV